MKKILKKAYAILTDTESEKSFVLTVLAVIVFYALVILAAAIF